jgi:hypothetical protein
MALHYFDCNCSIGRFAVPQPASIFTPGEMLAEMDYMGIEQALVYHARARESDPMEGNALLMEEIAGLERLIACWVVMPHHTGEFPYPAQLVPMLLSENVKAVRIFPGSAWHHWSLREWSAGPLLSELAACHIPLFVDFNQIRWDDVQTIGKTYPALPLIITGVRYEESRHFYPLLETLPNFISIYPGRLFTSGWKQSLNVLGRGASFLAAICRFFLPGRPSLTFSMRT